MKTIKVFIYSYKNKNLLEKVIELKNNQSNINKIKYFIYDQSGTDKSNIFNKLDNVFYRYIQWDNTRGIPYYRSQTISQQNSNYFLELSTKISLPKNWDIYLIESLPNNAIISGNSLKKIKVVNQIISYDEEQIDKITESNFIDIDFIFLKEQHAIFLNKLFQLKYYGQDLFASIIYSSIGIKIFSLNSDFYEKTISKDDILYYPYSKTHGYNKMIDNIRSLDNSLFEKFHNIKISDIPKISYQVDDVMYHNPRTSLDNSESPKFHSGYSTVRVV